MNLIKMARQYSGRHRAETLSNASWLQEHMSPYFFQAMTDEPEALNLLAREMGSLKHNRRVILSDRDNLLVLACVNTPGSIFDTVRQLGEREIAYAMFSHSDGLMPESGYELEVHRYEFGITPNQTVAAAEKAAVPESIAAKVRSELRISYPDFDMKRCQKYLRLLWLNNEGYVRMSPPSRIATMVWLLDRGNASGGLFSHIREVERNCTAETQVLLAVGNPPGEEFMLQLLEVFNRLDIGIRRAYCLTISNGIHPYFLGSFYVIDRAGSRLHLGGEKAAILASELCTTQILSVSSPIYRDRVETGSMSGEDAALIDSFVAFCHTTLAHSQPERFGFDDVRLSFHDHPEMSLMFVRLFRVRFSPEQENRESSYASLLAKTRNSVDSYNTGHKWLDGIRKKIYFCCLLLVTHTLKTNFFVSEKQALAFRLDPSYLRELGEEFTGNLPDALPFRITFFFSRYGSGYHIGFSDIARGGWRTVIARSPDDFITASNTIFREVYVLAHTQHLKNKDIYEGGSKMALVLDASDISPKGTDAETCRLYKLQYGVINAFLDIFVTDDGKPRDRRVVDYYGDDEPIEIGPDENMHDGMIEAIASLSRKRHYILGSGIISSKKTGINHKEYGVTSTGVATFADIAMRDIGIDIRNDPFTLKMTGGPNGDVAGNLLRILIDRCPGMRILLILDGTAAICDPSGINREGLGRIILKYDLDAFDPAFLGESGRIIQRTGRKSDGARELFRSVERVDGSLVETWLETDDFFREYNSILFTVKADLFVPAGGRPETIDSGNWFSFLLEDGSPSSRVIVEGANSFISPEARNLLQKSGVTILRDASANKCGVISSSYEIIANLLLADDEYIACKDRYVADVLSILEKRASDEAKLIMARRRESGGTLLCTEISETISRNINSLYHRLFDFFMAKPELCLQRPFRNALLNHLPPVISGTPRFRKRISRLPPKYRAAILAAEIGSSMVYSCNRDADFEDMVRRHLAREP